MRNAKTDHVGFFGLLCSLLLFHTTWATAADCDNECRERTSFVSDGGNGQTCVTYSTPDCYKCVQTLSQCKGSVGDTYCDPSSTGMVQIKFQTSCPLICTLVPGGIAQAAPGVNLSPWSDPVELNVCFI